MGRLVAHVGGAELARVRASSVLALEASALTGGVELRDGEPVDVVGVVEVEGPLAERATATLCGYVDGYDALAERFARAAEAGGGVLLRLRSPGGDVAGLEQAVERMRAARRGPVVAYVDELAASAAYWVAAAVADEIVVPPSGRVGSIGCIGVAVDESEAVARDGVRLTVVRSPAGKAEALSVAPLSELTEQRLRASVEAASGRFAAAVAAARGLSVQAIEALDGAVLEGALAVRAGLADRVGGRDVALSRLAERMRETRMAEQAERALAALGVSDEGALEARVAELLALEAEVARVTGATGSAAVGAVVGLAESARVGREALAQLQTERAQQAQREHEALIERLVQDRKLTPAQREWARTQSVESLRAFAAVAPTAPYEAHEEPRRDVRLSAFERRVAHAMKMTEDEFAAHKAAMAATMSQTEE